MFSPFLQIEGKRFLHSSLFPFIFILCVLIALSGNEVFTKKRRPTVAFFIYSIKLTYLKRVIQRNTKVGPAGASCIIA
jgi:hypothetical protein